MRKPAASLPSDSPEVIGAKLEEMERKIDRLRSLYETFFAGIERRPPNVPRRELNRLLLEMQQILIRNAALRFRFQSLMQRWTLLTTYWNRTLREIEAGTYSKDLARVSRRLAEKGAPLSEAEAIALGIPASRAKALVARQSRGRPQPTADAAAPPIAAGATAGAKPAAAAPPAGVAIAVAVPGMSDADIEALHQRYDQAARSIDGTRAAPPLAKLREMLAKRVPELLSQHGAGRLHFEVAVRDGRVVLRAKPEK